ncbi:hypothetical protein NKG94_37410 [Micromonospora sp. M12]
MKRLTIRARLTLIYGGLFLLAGMVLLAVTYVLVDQRMPQPFGVKLSDLPKAAPRRPAGRTSTTCAPSCRRCRTRRSATRWNRCSPRAASR